MSIPEVIAAHTGADWRVAFGGFAPGFAYLSWGDPRLAVPRRKEPRTSVPSGSCGFAGEFSAIYPRSSPGGWQLIGHTDIVVFDIDRDPPALLQPDAVVRFLDASGAGDGALTAHWRCWPLDLLTLVQDLGRIGFASVGVGHSGAADRGAFRLGARLLAQPYTAAALEVTLGGLSVRATRRSDARADWRSGTG